MLWFLCLVLLGFQTPLGTWVIGGLHCLPLWLYGYHWDLLSNPLSLPSWLQALGTLLLAVGRLLGLSVEVRIHKWLTHTCFQDSHNNYVIRSLLTGCLAPWQLQYVIWSPPLSRYGVYGHTLNTLPKMRWRRRRGKNNSSLLPLTTIADSVQSIFPCSLLLCRYFCNLTELWCRHKISSRWHCRVAFTVNVEVSVQDDIVTYYCNTNMVQSQISIQIHCMLSRPTIVRRNYSYTNSKRG